MKKRKQKLKNGFTLVEVLLTLFLTVLVIGGILAAVVTGLKLIGKSKAMVIATGIVNEKLEEVRNLSYEDVGVQGSYPSGTLPSSETLTRNNIEFTIEYRVDYVDDPTDERAPNDACPNDYKLVKIKVTWSGISGGSVYGNTIVAPKDQVQECNEVGGLLSVSVFDAKGNMVPSPLIEVENLQTGLTKTAQPDSGEYFFVLPEGIDAYKITVSKNNYSQEQTFGIGDVYNGKTIATPENPHATVLEGELTEKSFSIDELSTFNIKTLEAKTDGQIYYVRQTGNDNYDGLSPNTAFRTIQKAAEVMKPGDIVFVGGGVYQETVTPQNSGTQSKHIVFVADQSGTYTGDSGDVEIQGGDFGFYIDNKQYIELYNFKITNTSSSAVYIKSNGLPSHIKIGAINLTNNSGDGIVIENTSQIEIVNSEFSFNKRGVVVTQSSDVLFQNTDIFQNSQKGGEIKNSSKITFSFGEIYLNGEEGIFLNGGGNHEIKHAFVFLNTKSGIYASTTNTLSLEDNKIYSNQQSGIFLENVSSGSIISNLVYRNKLSGILIKKNSQDIVLSNNTFSKNLENGIFIDSSSNIEIKNNIITENSLVGLKVQNSTAIENSYNDVWQNTTDYDGLSPGTSSLNVDPLFVDPDGEDNILGEAGGEDDNFHLSQIEAGQSLQSPCVDAGSDTASNLNMDEKTTRTDSVTDSGTVDMGYHYSLQSPPYFEGYPSPFGDPIANVEFHLQGEKIVGKDENDQPIYKYSYDHQTNDSGEVSLQNLEWDQYTFSNFSSGGATLDLVVSWPSPMPIVLYPGVVQEVKLGLKAANTLLVKVEDSQTGTPIFNAQVTLSNSTLGYQRSILTDEKGEAYFIPLVSDSNYSLKVEADGYQTYQNSNILISGHMEKTVDLTPSD